MRTLFVLLCAAAVVCAAAGALYAPPHGGGGRHPGTGGGRGPGNGPGATADLTYAEGVVKTINHDVKNEIASIVIARKGEKGNELAATIAVNGETQVFAGEDPKELSDLAPGDKVIAAFAKPKEGVVPMAVLIRIVKTPDASEKAPAKPAPEAE